MIQTYSLLQMEDILDAPITRHCYRYLLVDPARKINEFNDLSLNNLAKHLGKQAIEPVLRPDLAYDVSYCPHLVTIGQPLRLMDNFLAPLSLFEAEKEKQISKHYFCGWLITQLPPAELARKLIQIGTDLGHVFGRSYSPFYEPMRFQLLQEKLAQQNDNRYLAEAFSFVDYYYPTLNQYEFALVTQNGDPDFIPKMLVDQGDTPSTVSLKLSAEEINQHKCFFLIQTLCLTWLRAGNRGEEGLLLRCAQSISSALQYGIRDERDIIGLAYFALTYGMASYQDPNVQAAIKLGLAEPGSLEYQLDQITDDLWHERLQQNGKAR